MREIKFRAWGYDGSRIGKKEMFIPYCEEFNDINDSISNLQDEEIVLMQYTGLKDLLLTEIYENDIVFCLDRSFNHRVEWDDDRAMFRLIPIGKANYYAIDFNADMIIESELKVIGNIYENPELITQLSL